MIDLRKAFQAGIAHSTLVSTGATFYRADIGIDERHYSNITPSTFDVWDDARTCSHNPYTPWKFILVVTGHLDDTTMHDHGPVPT